MNKTNNFQGVAVMRIGISSVIVSIFLAGSSVSATKQDVRPDPMNPRTLRPTRIQIAPSIDGRIEDTCWDMAQPITDFLTHRTDRLAAFQATAFICYDDAHLYIAIKCMMPEGGTPKGQDRPHDTYIFSDDTVEIFLDPGRRHSHYYQLAVNAYGATFDTRRQFGGTHDPAWNGDWIAATSIEKEFWSVELAIPFHNLGISRNLDADWGINICRDTASPRSELASIAPLGDYSNVTRYPRLEGIDVDFSDYFFTIGPTLTRLNTTTNPYTASFKIPITNETGKTQRVKVERWFTDTNGNVQTESQVVSLANDETLSFAQEGLAIEPLADGRNDAFIIRSAPSTKKIVVTDGESGRILALSKVQRPWYLEAMRLEVADPWQQSMDRAPWSELERLPRDPPAPVEVTIELNVDEAVLANSQLALTVSDQTVNIEDPRPTQSVTVNIAGKHWGAHEVVAILEESENGRDLIDAFAIATTLPGRPQQQIRVLNNMVSELVNLRERGLAGESKIEFMNPRDGWVFFRTDPNPVSIMLNQEPDQLFQQGAIGHKAGEAMRYLKAGRHVLHLDGKPADLVVRTIPDLIYATIPNQFRWDYLTNSMLQNATTILGSNVNEEWMRQWKATGRNWINFAVAPGHGGGGEKFYSAEEYYQHLLTHGGFNHPLTDGAIFDQIGAASVEQKIEFAGAFARIQADPNLKGRSYQAWYEGEIFGSEGDLAFMKLAMDAGWPYSFYVYLTEQQTQQQIRADIESNFILRAHSAEGHIPGSLRRAIVTLGFWTAVATGQIQDIDPGANFKILMQMQMNALANHTDLFGLYGLFWYYSPYVDEEIDRFASALFRHYAIEGNTGPLINDPYRLTHLSNPDFEHGTKGWTISEAEPGSVSVKNHVGYGDLQGRYLGGSRGDTFLTTRRSSKHPNVISQQLKDLTPGRVYSFKMITADYQNIIGEKSVDAADSISIRFDNTEPVAGPNANEVLAGEHRGELPSDQQVTFPNHYGHLLGKFRGDYHAYMNSHWRLFRALGETAELTISDWAAPDHPGGTEGQEIMINYIQVEPYFEGQP